MAVFHQKRLLFLINSSHHKVGKNRFINISLLYIYIYIHIWKMRLSSRWARELSVMTLTGDV